MKTFVFVLFALLITYIASPYYQIWRLDQAVMRNDQTALAELVDLEAVREQIKRRLNKEENSAVGDVSNAFIAWIQDGIARLGSEAVEQLVTLDWVRDQLLSKNPDGAQSGFIDQIDYAFFERPDAFIVRIGHLGDEPVHIRLSVQDMSWRVTALYN